MRASLCLSLFVAIPFKWIYVFVACVHWRVDRPVPLLWLSTSVQRIVSIFKWALGAGAGSTQESPRPHTRKWGPWSARARPRRGFEKYRMFNLDLGPHMSGNLFPKPPRSSDKNIRILYFAKIIRRLFFRVASGCGFEIRPSPLCSSKQCHRP